LNITDSWIRSALILSSFALLLAFARSPSLPAGPPRWCGDGGAAGWALQAIIGVVEADGAEGDVARRLYSLPRTTRDSVLLVSDEAVCERASRAYYRYRLGPTPPGGVAVMRVSDRYAVFGANRAGEWTILSIYSLAFEPIANLAI
jgi:hypothetical protein